MAATPGFGIGLIAAAIVVLLAPGPLKLLGLAALWGVGQGGAWNKAGHSRPTYMPRWRRTE